MEFEPKEEQTQSSLGQRVMKEGFEFLKIFVICFVSVYLITNFVAKPIRVDGSSMYPTLQDGEIGVTNVFGLKTGEASRFDVVIIHNDEANEHWVKRVIGLPGDTIEAKDDVVYINGKAIEEPFLNTEYVNDLRKNGQFTNDFGPVALGEDEYFLMGDNRIVSTDSRIHGPFKSSELIGKDVLIVFPFDEFKVVRNPNA